ncbi:MAG: hypothetical protein M1325_05100 [Actinobacteria bacterium]|nr:hypothetical protein [Actinomycetota bacterium]
MRLEEHTGYRAPLPPARVRLEMGARVFEADVHLPDVDFRARVSDVVNDPGRRFLPLADVDLVDGQTGRVLSRTPFMLVRLDAIDLIVPLREPAERPVLE